MDLCKGSTLIAIGCTNDERSEAQKPIFNFVETHSPTGASVKNFQAQVEKGLNDEFSYTTLPPNFLGMH